jgi:subtilisin family serine protease
MLRSFRLRISAVAFVLVLIAPVLSSQTIERKKVISQADLPRFTYPIAGTASDLLQADAGTFSAFAAKVRADLDSIFAIYDIEDKATLRSLLSARLNLQQASGENQLALETLASLLKLSEKPTDNMRERVLIKPELQAAIDAKGTSGPVFEQAFRRYFREAWDALPPDVAQDRVRSVLFGTSMYNSAVVIGEVKADLDPAVQKSGVLSKGRAWRLIEMRNTLQIFFPVRGVTLEVLRRYLAAHNAQQFDIWQAREMTLGPDRNLTPVAVGIWDSGVDVSLFPDQLFSDPHPTASGNHGLAFDDNGDPSTSWLLPLTEAQKRQYPDFLAEMKGRQDLEDGIDSPEATAVMKRAGTLTPEQIRDRESLERILDHFQHGTHVAGIAARGNPAVRLVVARFNADISNLPFQPTAEYARRIAADFQQISDYLRTRNVRVVNMSWENDPQEFEAWLTNTGAGASPEERKRLAAEMFGIWRDGVETAVRGAPNTLFVCAAGNSNHDAAFSEDVPASLHLPNLISVGAVNWAGRETDFTSYGDTVVVQANGDEVESYVPGGSKLKKSGTSMASPNVANLAAKLIALDPSLTPGRVIELIKRGATASADGRLHLINPKASVALLQASR